MTPAEQRYYYDMLFIGLNLSYFLYVIYGRIKKRPLIKPVVGDYRPGTAGHAVFMRFIHNNWILSGAALFMFLSLADAAVNVREILREPGSHSALFEAPIIMAISFAILIAVIPAILRGDNKK